MFNVHSLYTLWEKVIFSSEFIFWRIEAACHVFSCHMFLILVKDTPVASNVCIVMTS